MKRALAVVGQAILFVVVFLAGSLWDPFGMKWMVSHPTATSTRFFVPDGLILMVVLYVVIVALEAASDRLRTAGLGTTIALVLALVVGLLGKFGWATHDLF